MINKEVILLQVKETLPIDQRDRDDHIDRSFLFAVAELTNRLQKLDRLTSYNESVAVSAREIVLDGYPGDMNIYSIFYLVYNPGNEQVVLQYRDPDVFFKDYYNPDVDSGTPTYYTYLGLDDDNQIKIAFDVPSASAVTMRVYYFKDMDENTVRNTEGPALVNMTLAFFVGSGTDEGIKYHGLATANLKAAKANAKRIVDNEKGFVQSRDDAEIAALRQSMRNSR